MAKSAIVAAVLLALTGAQLAAAQGADQVEGLGASATPSSGVRDEQAKGAAVTPPADLSRALSYGRHLALECSGCHRLDGVDNGIPSIVGWPAERFAAAMATYKSGDRKNAVMVSVAKSLDDEQVQALAQYYGSLERPAAGDASRGPARP